MTMLSAAQLASMRATAAEALPETGTVYRRTTTTDSAGGFTIAEASQGTLSCRLDPVSSRDAILQTYAERIGSRPVFVMYFEQGGDVLANDKVVIGSENYEVIGILERSWEVSLQALVVSQE